jgi:hypothetical protein
MTTHKIYLVGYPGSQRIVPASKYLTSKYLPGFDITYLNYTGEVKGWAAYVSAFLSLLTDEHVILSLDDYLLSGPINIEMYKGVVKIMEDNTGGVAKLCYCTSEENTEYPITTQYSIWNRKYLMTLLSLVSDPWEFETLGSRIHNQQSKHSFVYSPCIPYFTNSSISSKWVGVRLDGLSDEDIQYIQSHGLIK